MQQNSNLKYAFRISMVMAFLVAGIWLLRQPPTELTPEVVLHEQLTGQVESEVEDEAAQLEWIDYWTTRYTYPTFQFDSNWWLEAAEQDARIERAVPAGKVSYDPANSLSPLTLDPSQFTSLGPAPLNYNSQIGNTAGRTNFIVSDPISPNIAYAGSDGGGVWKTTNCCDSATTWTPVTDGNPLINSIAIGHLEIDPNDHNTVYAGTGDLRYGSFSFGSAGVLKTTDAGDNWVVLGASVFGPARTQPAGEFPQYQAISKVKVDPRDSNNLIVGTKTGLFFSYDAGTNWTGPCLTNSYTDQRQDITDILVYDNGSSTDVWVANGTRGFPTPVQGDLGLTGANGVYKTTFPASGCPASWTLQNSGWPAGTGDGDPANDQVGRIDLAMAPSNPNVIYAQVASNVSSGSLIGVWRTGDGGATWTLQSTPTSGVAQTWYNAGLVVDPNDPDTVFLSTLELHRSTDGGSNFTIVSGGETHVDHHARAYVGGDSSKLLIGNDGGVYYTANADTPVPTDIDFIPLNDTLPTIELYSGDITANFATSANPGINAGAQDNGSEVFVWSGDPGPAEWVRTNGGDGMYARIEPINGQRWYQEFQNGVMRVSISGPFGSWSTASLGWGGDRLSFIMPYELDKYNCSTICDHMIAGTYRVWETVVGAIPSTSWYINSPDLTKGTLADRSHINQLAYAVTDGTVAIVGTNDGNVQYGFGLGQGTANSATWVDVTGGNTVLPNRPILDVATSPANPLVGYAAVGGFDQNTPGTPGHVFEVTCSADCATFTWVDKSGNLPNIPADSIIANPNYPQQVFAGTDWGLYFTDDITADPPTWLRFEAGLPNVMIWDMAIDRGFTTLALFTRSRGAYAWPLPAGPVNPPNYGATLGPDSYIDTLPGTTVTHNFALNNIGLNNDSYTLVLDAGAWTTTLETSSPISVDAGSSKTVSVTVQVPHTPYASDTFTVTATSVNSPTVVIQTIGNTTAAVNPAVSVTSDIDAQSGEPGNVLTYTVTVTNTGDYTDTFSLSLSGNSWAVTAETTSTGPMAPGAVMTIEIYVTVGAGSSDSVTVTLTSGLDGGVSDSVTLTSSLSSFEIYMPALTKN